MILTISAQPGTTYKDIAIKNRNAIIRIAMSYSILNIESLTALPGEKFICCNITSLDAMVQQETIAGLLSCIEKLPVKCKEIINLYYFRNQSIHEMKARPGVSESAVMNRLSHELHLLKTQFSKKPKNPV